MLRIYLLSLFLFVAQASLFAQAQEVSPNLLENGNFATGTTGWDIFLTDPNVPIKAQVIERGESYKKYGLADNYVGTNFVELDANSAIKQKATTDANEPHILVFAYAHRPNAGDKQLIVEVNGEAIWTKTVKNSAENGEFTYKVIKLNSVEEETAVTFYTVSLSGDDDKGILLTDVLLNEEPAVDLKLFYEY